MLTLHHFGLLTGDIDASSQMLVQLGYSRDNEAIDPLQGAHLRMFVSDDGANRIELVSPLEENTSLQKLLKHKRDHIYHICFTCTSITAAQLFLEKISNGPVLEISGPKPAILFDGRLVGFYMCQGLGLVEILED